RFAVALPQRHARRPTHRGDGAAVSMAVHRHLYRHSPLPEHVPGIARERDEAHRAVADDSGFEDLRDHCGAGCWVLGSGFWVLGSGFSVLGSRTAFLNPEPGTQ